MTPGQVCIQTSKKLCLSVFYYVYLLAKSLQSCLSLCDPKELDHPHTVDIFFLWEGKATFGVSQPLELIK